ncbi:MAG: hypothetical protein ACLUGQ_08445 [Coprococcus sp.]
MIKADGTKDKSRLGANAILAVSIASSKSKDLYLWIFLCIVSLEEFHGNRLPVPMMNIVNGGRSCTFIRTGCTGVHDYACRSSEFQGSV